MCLPYPEEPVLVGTKGTANDRVLIPTCSSAYFTPNPESKQHQQHSSLNLSGSFSDLLAFSEPALVL